MMQIHKFMRLTDNLLHQHVEILERNFFAFCRWCKILNLFKSKHRRAHSAQIFLWEFLHRLQKQMKFATMSEVLEILGENF